MKQVWVIFVLFGILNIVFPQLIAYLLGTLFILIGMSLLMTGVKFGSKKKNEEAFVKFGNYKIYR